MIAFPYTRTRRLAVALVELTLGEAISLCKLPVERHELTTTELLRAIAKKAEQPMPRYVTDPRLMTVEERTMLVCLYLAQVIEDGPNFAVGPSAHLSDYVTFDADITKEQTDLGDVAGKPRIMRPLLGLHAETLETLCSSRGDWIVGAIASQIFDRAEEVPDWGSMSQIAMLEWMKPRIDAVRGMPESEFEQVYAAYMMGTRELRHFFSVNFDRTGIVYEANEQEGEAGAITPARFFASSCISSLARALS